MTTASTRVCTATVILVAAACAATPGADRSGGATDFYSGLSNESRSLAESTLQATLEKNVSGEQRGWRANDESFGFLTPVETWESQSGHWCRRFAETLRASGEARDREAVACRIDGRWRMSEA